jgi:crotonobetainyl-CoA:carnitine CoA-transferase CaiB-like acyl-CoA transferase
MSTTPTSTTRLLSMWAHLDEAIEQVTQADRRAHAGDDNIAIELFAAAAAQLNTVEDALDNDDFGDDRLLVEFELDGARSVLLRHLAGHAPRG